MKQYQVTLTGVSPLLLHNINISWGDEIARWRKDPDNKGGEIASDRNPAWTWIGYCYYANGVVVLDADNLMAMLRDAGKKCAASVGRGSLKAATQSGIMVDQIGWPIQTSKGLVSQSDIESLVGEKDFSLQEKFAIEHGFELFVKRASIGTQKHIRVRPRFNSWSAQGTVTVLDDTLYARLDSLFEQAGRFVGIGDWRPGSRSSGRFGMFSTKIEEIK